MNSSINVCVLKFIDVTAAQANVQYGEPKFQGAPLPANNYDDDDDNNSLFDCRHTVQSNTTNIHHAGWDTKQPPRRAALYTEGLSGKRQATKGGQRLINRI